MSRHLFFATISLIGIGALLSTPARAVSAVRCEDHFSNCVGRCASPGGGTNDNRCMNRCTRQVNSCLIRSHGGLGSSSACSGVYLAVLTTPTGNNAPGRPQPARQKAYLVITFPSPASKPGAWGSSPSPNSATCRPDRRSPYVGRIGPPVAGLIRTRSTCNPC